MIRIFCLLSMLFFLNLSSAQQSSGVITAYENAWSEPDSLKRLEQIKTFWAENGEYHDGAAKVKGPKGLNDMIQKFRKDFPNSIASSNPLLSFENYRTWSWRIINTEKNLFLEGRDFMELDKSGKIINLIGFWEKYITNENTSSATNEEIKKENQKVVGQYFQYLFKTGDFVSMKNIIAKDAVYKQAEGLPYGGTYTGFNEWIKMYSKAQQYFDLTIEKEPIYYTNSIDNDIMLSFTIKCKAKISGAIMIMPISEYFEVKDGSITGIRAFYFDTKSLVNLLNNKLYK